MPTDEQMYEGKTERDLIIGLLKDVKTMKHLLVGNGIAGKKGLVSKVDGIEETVIRHKVYFGLMGGAIIAAIPLGAWVLNYLS